MRDLTQQEREVMKTCLGVSYEELSNLTEEELDALYQRAADFEVEEAALRKNRQKC
ncbi:hypothetical protein [Veillonella ratti]|uniref:hypothetical protein n=1 Tax=Veillonella ratti TaxID=103892 RepID=UPI0013DFF384|nr:hypothetical protein [Veillonella ratti]